MGPPRPVAAWVAGGNTMSPVHSERRSPLWGLVLAGGTSTHGDLDALGPGGRPLLETLAKTVKPVTDKRVLVLSKYAPFPHSAQHFDLVLRDPFEGPRGPMAGLAEAMFGHPGVAFLAVACDDSDFTRADVSALIAERRPPRLACAFEEGDALLPLPALYEGGVLPLLFQELDAGRDSLARFLADLSEGQLGRVSRRRRTMAPVGGSAAP